MNKLSTTLIAPVFTTAYRVIYGDTDAAGVMYNANYLRLFEIGRTEMMRAWAMPYRTMEDLGCILPVTESYLRFKAPAPAGHLTFNVTFRQGDNDMLTIKKCQVVEMVGIFTAHSSLNKRN